MNALTAPGNSTATGRLWPLALPQPSKVLSRIGQGIAKFSVSNHEPLRLACIILSTAGMVNRIGSLAHSKNKVSTTKKISTIAFTGLYVFSLYKYYQRLKEKKECDKRTILPGKLMIKSPDAGKLMRSKNEIAVTVLPNNDPVSQLGLLDTIKTIESTGIPMMIKTINSTQDLNEMIVNLKSKGIQVKILFICAHGTDQEITLGNDVLTTHGIYKDNCNSNIATHLFQESLKQLHPEAQIVLSSCNTAGTSDEKKSIAFSIAKMIPGRTVYAPSADTSTSRTVAKVRGDSKIEFKFKAFPSNKKIISLVATLNLGLLLNTENAFDLIFASGFLLNLDPFAELVSGGDVTKTFKVQPVP